MSVIPEHLLKRMNTADRAKLGKAGRTNDEIAIINQARQECQLQEQVAAYLRLRGVRWFYRARMDRRTTAPVGTPDFLFVCRGKAYALEVKVPGGRVSDEQTETLLMMRADGWCAEVVRSIADVKKILEGK